MAHCDYCGRPHGPLYICESYGPEKVAELKAKSDEFEKQVASGGRIMLREILEGKAN